MSIYLLSLDFCYMFGLLIRRMEGLPLAQSVSVHVCDCNFDFFCCFIEIAPGSRRIGKPGKTVCFCTSASCSPWKFSGEDVGSSSFAFIWLISTCFSLSSNNCYSWFIALHLYLFELYF